MKGDVLFCKFKSYSSIHRYVQPITLPFPRIIKLIIRSQGPLNRFEAFYCEFLNVYVLLSSNIITKLRLYNFDRLKPTFMELNLFLILLKNIDCGYSLEPPHRGGSNEYP